MEEGPESSEHLMGEVPEGKEIAENDKFKIKEFDNAVFLITRSDKNQSASPSAEDLAGALSIVQGRGFQVENVVSFPQAERFATHFIVACRQREQS